MAFSGAIAIISATCCTRFAAAPTSPRNPNSGLIAAPIPIQWIPSAATKVSAASLNHVDSFYGAVEACIDKGDEAAGRQLHGSIVECGLDCHAFFGSHLVRMFTAFHRLPEAQQVFRRIHCRNLHAWRAIISSHSALGRHEEAMSLWFDLCREKDDCDGINGHVIVAALDACAGSPRRRGGSLSNGWAIHAQAIEHGLELGHSFVANALLHMYAMCGWGMDQAAVMFDRMRMRIEGDTVAWNTMLAGYNRSGEGEQALRIFATMMLEQQGNVVGAGRMMPERGGNVVGSGSFGGRMMMPERGGNVVGSGSFGGRMMMMPERGGNVVGSGSFGEMMMMPERGGNVVGSGSFGGRMMMPERGGNVVGSEPMQAATILSVLKACAITEDAEAGRAAHAYTVEHGLEHEARIESALVDMYGKCGRLIDARSMLLSDHHHHHHHMPSIASWNAFLGACVREGEGHAALALLPRMMTMMREELEEELLQEPNGVTLACLARACSSVAALGCGRKVHAEAVCKGLMGLNPFVCSALVDMYATCGCIDDARLVFDRMPDRLRDRIPDRQRSRMPDTMPDTMLDTMPETILDRMPDRMPNRISDKMPDRMLDRMLDTMPNRILDRMPDRMPDRISDKMPERMPEEEEQEDAMMWTAMVQAYALHGDHAMAMECFSRMKQRQMPEAAMAVASLCILSAYARLNLLRQGCEFFRQVRDERGGRVELEHLNSMVGLLGRTGHMEQAEELLECAPFASNGVGWRALLGSCRRWKDTGTGSRCFGRLVAMDAGHGASYSIMSSIYAEAGMRAEAIGIGTAKRCMRGAGGGASTMKKPGRAFIEVGTTVHEFGVGDESHAQIAAIRDKLRELNLRMKEEEGHRPRVELVFDPRLASDTDKEEALCGHCERLALAFGLLSATPGTSLRILKNLRMCPDCHSAVKCISKIEAREIFVKDSYCLHRFDAAGECSCRD